MLTNKKIFTVVETSAHQEEFYFKFDFFIFLLQYSFLFSNKDTTQKTCTLKTNHFLVSQGNGENGARYLDPKYSRWISVDPALGEYVPAAGKSNEADKLPGMGGIYNSVNLSLYHYAGNNPVKYTDPDGKTQVYFLYTYKKHSFYDQKMLRDEWSSIMDDVKKLRDNGISVFVNLAATKEDIINAFKDEEAILIVTSGHGYEDGSIQTTGGLHFYPHDLPAEISKNLKIVVMENCCQEGSKWYKNENGIKWRDKLGAKIKFIGWKGSTTKYESIRFNDSGWFDRQKQSLNQLVDEVITHTNKQKEENYAE